MKHQIGAKGEEEGRRRAFHQRNQDARRSSFRQCGIRDRRRQGPAEHVDEITHRAIVSGEAASDPPSREGDRSAALSCRLKPIQQFLMQTTFSV
jgi:hypothetical protein